LDGLLSDNAAAGFRAARGTREATPEAATRVLDREQLARLLAACTSTWTEVMVRLSAEAGLRLGEVIGLRWGDVDLRAREVTVARSVWQEAGQDGARPTRHVKAPKSGQARDVAVSTALAGRLADLYAEAVVEGGQDAAAWVFPGRDGGPMDSSTPGRMLRRACLRAGLTSPDGAPLVSWHRLRHTAGSLMLAAGVPLPDVSAQLRHADPSITARVYSHSLGRDRQHAAAAFFDAPPTPGTVGETVGEPRSLPRNRTA
jgi:integrase